MKTKQILSAVQQIVNKILTDKQNGEEYTGVAWVGDEALIKPVIETLRNVYGYNAISIKSHPSKEPLIFVRY